MVPFLVRAEAVKKPEGYQLIFLLFVGSCHQVTKIPDKNSHSETWVANRNIVDQTLDSLFLITVYLKCMV